MKEFLNGNFKKSLRIWASLYEACLLRLTAWIRSGRLRLPALAPLELFSPAAPKAALRDTAALGYASGRLASYPRIRYAKALASSTIE